MPEIYFSVQAFELELYQVLKRQVQVQVHRFRCK